jgi:hypothetical protein
VLAPILVFVSLEMTAQAFVATPARYAVAVAFSFFPAIARLLVPHPMQSLSHQRERLKQLSTMLHGTLSDASPEGDTV